MLNEVLALKILWSDARRAADPEQFSRFAALRAHEFVRIRCPDGRVSANVFAGLVPGGVKAATGDLPHRPADHWPEPLRLMARAVGSRRNKLAELDVTKGGHRLCAAPILQKAWKEPADLGVHGLICGLGEGRPPNLGCTVVPEHFGQEAAE